MKKGIFVLLILLSSQAFGYNNAEGSSVAYIEALLWKFSEAGTENWGQVFPASSIAPQQITVLNVPFNWSPGFRIGIGHKFCYDCWDTMFYYTWYQTSGLNDATAPSGGHISSPYAGNFFANNTNGQSISANPTYKTAQMDWKVHFNTIDLELGRGFSINKYLNLRPFIGIKAAIINQHIDTSWQSPTNVSTFSFATENLKNYYWGVGPELGMDTKWFFCKSATRSIDIFGNFALAAMYGHWHFADQYINNTPATVTVNFGNINGGSCMARGILGLEWFGCVARSKVSVRLGYEVQVWFDQLQLYIYNMGRTSNLMSLQGAVLGFSYYF